MLMILTMEVLAIVAIIDKQTGVLLFGDAFFLYLSQTVDLYFYFL